MSMTHPLSGDNSILDSRGISVQGVGFRVFDQMKSALSSKEMLNEARDDGEGSHR